MRSRRRSVWRFRARSRGTSSPPCRARCSEAEATTPATSSSSVRGPDALLCRYFSGRRRWGRTTSSPWSSRAPTGAITRRSCAPSSSGRRGPEQQAMFRVCSRRSKPAWETIRPGRVFGDVFDAHARVLDGAGYRAPSHDACGYSHGATFAPTWADGPMFVAGNPRPIEPGMVLFVHVILADSDAGLAMSAGETVIVAPGGRRAPEPGAASHRPRDRLKHRPSSPPAAAGPPFAAGPRLHVREGLGSRPACGQPVPRERQQPFVGTRKRNVPAASGRSPHGAAGGPGRFAHTGRDVISGYRGRGAPAFGPWYARAGKPVAATGGPRPRGVLPGAEGRAPG